MKEADTLRAKVIAAGDVIKIIASLDAARNELVSKLKDDPKFQESVAKAALLPSGLVAAFKPSPSERVCPTGWNLYDKAGGRFIIGAGPNANVDQSGSVLTDWNLEAEGGEEMHVLSVNEMPSHAHSLTLTRRWGDKSNGSPTGWGGDDGPNGDVTLSVTEAGGSAPHNTMPPFVALYYCIKE